MTTGSRRDGAAVAAGVARWLAQRDGLTRVAVAGVDRPSGGYASETVFVDLVTTGAGGREAARALVVRLPPAGPGTVPAHDLAAEVEAQRAAAAAGVPVAEPTYEPDPAWVGSPFVVMPKVEGHVVGALAHRDPWLRSIGAEGSAAVADHLLEALARVHAADPAAAPSLPRRDNRAELDHWEAYLDWSTDGAPVPTLVDGVRWCRDHLPATEPDPVVLWGDVRLENVVYGDDLRPRAVLDWDLATVGAPHHDLAWLTSLDATTVGLFGRRADGFPDRQALVARYQSLTGRSLDDLGWYETLAMVRSTAIFTRIGVLQQAAGEPPLLPLDDNPLLDLLRARLG